eukprot:CAMPEP_0197051320 /NCGR_PEP_ID=MMETSP1384-20130603/26015_1 /TAXON_ID=29189 /ORGANISM="Ammonia sp." /LENGTH=431 /DNA_ID=CAMNT_0042483869 /DNA_START=1 /DNA_END=1296 /DNA_ORIENTATION=-
MVQNQYLLPRHEEITMRLLFFTAIALLVVYTCMFVMAIAIYDEDEDQQYQSYLPDNLRVFQLLFEITFMVLAAVLFVYIPPNPELYEAHRSSFHLHQKLNTHDGNLMMGALAGGVKFDHDDDENSNDDDEQRVIHDAQSVLKKDTKVYVQVDDGGDWVLGTVRNMSADETICFVSPDDHKDVAKYATDQHSKHIVINLSVAKEAKNLKLAMFGVDPAVLPSQTDRKYDLEFIPLVLLNLRSLLFKLGGQYKPGIFEREPTNLYQYDAFKLAVEQNRMDTFNYNDDQVFDVHNVACLMKAFYRFIPTHLKCLQHLHFSDDRILLQFQTIEDMKRLLEHEHPKYQLNAQQNNKQAISLLVWFWDLCSDIYQFAAKNEMSIESLAQHVVAPNVYDIHPQIEPPRKHRILQNVAAFCKLGIEYALNRRKHQKMSM